MIADLSVKLFQLELKNPVMPAAGPPVKDGAAAHAAKQGGAGALVTKTISTKAARVPRPNMVRVKAGFLNTELWSELSPASWIKEEYTRVRETGLPVVIGLGYTAREITELAPQVERFADALELSTHYLGNDPTPLLESIKAAKALVDLPVLVKLSPQGDIPSLSRAAEEAGADGLVLINSLGPTLEIDPATGSPLLGSANGYGWLSGEAIFPLALRSVFEAVRSVQIPVLGVGGISSGLEAVKMIMAGAQAVQVCTAAILHGPMIYGRIVREIEQFLTDHGYRGLEEIRGLAQKQANRSANFRTVVPLVKDENCNGCGICLSSCVYQAIELQAVGGPVLIKQDQCAGCGLCVSRCKFQALSLSGELRGW